MPTCTCQTPGAVHAAATEPLDSAYPVPAYPPRSWFEDKPDWLTPGMDVHVDDTGRVAGYFYDRGSCLIHDHTACPEPSATGYAAFTQQHLISEDGSEIRVGVIGNVGGHADPHARWDAAAAHYADPNLQLVACRAYDDDHGGYVLGAMLPGSSYGDVAKVRACSLSGDWRPMPPAWWLQHGIAASVARAHDFYDCIGPTLVTRPGLPMVARRGAALLGGLGGIHLEGDAMPEPTTTIDLPGGVRVTTAANATYAAPPGPQPIADDEAILAAPPPPPPPQRGPGGGPPQQKPPGGGGETVTRDEFDALVQKVADIADVVNGLMNAQHAAMEASVPALPPPLAEAASG